MRSSHADPEDAGEGYFASISDLMVGILFIFLLMLAVFAINYATEDKDKRIRELEDRVAVITAERDGLKNEYDALVLDRDAIRTRLIDRETELAVLRGEMSDLLGEHARLRDGLANVIAYLEGVSEGLKEDQGRLERVRAELLINIQRALEKRDISVEVDAAQGVLRLSSEKLFQSGEARFTEEGQARAKALIQEMEILLPEHPIFETVLIEGHTDTNPFQVEGGNWKLSTDRARAFLNWMTTATSKLGGLQNDRGQLLLGLAGYGETRPLRDIDGADPRNRRIEIRFLLSTNRESLSDRIRRLESLLLALRNLAGTQR